MFPKDVPDGAPEGKELAEKKEKGCAFLFCDGSMTIQKEVLRCADDAACSGRDPLSTSLTRSCEQEAQHHRAVGPARHGVLLPRRRARALLLRPLHLRTLTASQTPRNCVIREDAHCASLLLGASFAHWPARLVLGACRTDRPRQLLTAPSLLLPCPNTRPPAATRAGGRTSSATGSPFGNSIRS